MATTNRERVGLALELLRTGLASYVSREFVARHKANAKTELERIFDKSHEQRRIFSQKEPSKPFHHMDVTDLLRVMWVSWHNVFSLTLGHMERSLVSELREFRNRWAHQEPFSGDDTYRALDSAQRLLIAVSSKQASEVESMKSELQRVRFDEQARSQRRRASGTAAEKGSTSGLSSWRDVVIPHPDVASGHYQQAEFAADLWQVHLGEGANEYRNPSEFFRRTYLTNSLRGLLVNGLRRLSGQGGEPVVQLQTNFGGGKTHSMLALYHLFSGAQPGEMTGIDEIMQSAGVTGLPKVNRVVLVGNRISPGNPDTKPDGTQVRTLWGELAWQLGHAAGGPDEARKAYERVRADDERATNPGDALRRLLNDYGPSLILIDEWVAYARQLHDDNDLPGGSFETQFTFAQALSESAKLPPNCYLVISLPASDSPGGERAEIDDIEVGGVRGREALARLGNVVGRVDSSWRPAAADESFEIVRRRLFQPIITDNYATRDNVARAYHDLYRGQAQEFPAAAADADYEKRIREAYPIHPEVFERLYSDWSTLPSFQRTRGVLRLMAAVIHALWESGDRNPLIQPASIPLDDDRVQFELTRYLPANWVPVIESDIDGARSRPVQLDGEIASLGRHSASRRVARTVFFGSAPTQTAANQGIDDRRIKLGCAMPGETVSVFGDALRRLADSATYLYRDGARYWYSTQPTVANLAEDRAEELRRDRHRVAQEIAKWLRENLKERGDFKRIHLFPASGQDVQDDMEVGLVALGIDHPHTRGADSSALAAAKEIMESRGSAPRLFRNSLVFLAADSARLQDLEQAARQFLAWRSILEDREALDLPPHQVRQAQSQTDSAEGTVRARIGETFQWLLVPGQKTPRAAVEWQSIRLSGDGALTTLASRRLRNDEMLVTSMAGTRLRMELDRVPLWRGEQVPVRQLVDDFARYLYLPRLQQPSVLLDAIRDGLSLMTWSLESFAYADSFDEEGGRYRGLRVAQGVPIAESSPGLLVEPDAAQRQIDAEVIPDPDPDPDPDSDLDPGPGLRPDPDPPPPPPPPKAKRYHGSVELDPTRLGSEAGKIAEEVIAHLSGLLGAKVKLTLEIEAEIPDGTPDQVVRIVTENSRTLKFEDSGFERE